MRVCLPEGCDLLEPSFLAGQYEVLGCLAFGGWAGSTWRATTTSVIARSR
jgi:hypothetical protein